MKQFIYTICVVMFPVLLSAQTTFSEQIIIQENLTDGACSVYATDIDGDGDMDILSVSWGDDKIAWYENTDGSGTFGPQQVITTSANSAESVYAVDLDGDGDFDVLSASSSDDKIAWYENTDGFGTFGPQQVITTSAVYAQSVYTADLDGDGDFDVLSASMYDDKIAWYENTDGAGNFGPQQVITTSADGVCSVHSSDLDGDGDFDVLSASSGDDKIAWYENTDGTGTFGPQQVITTSVDYAQSVYTADLDGDGDMDVLSASASRTYSYDDKIAWYENTDGVGTFGSQQVITTSVDGARSVYSADLDGDGDMDVLSASELDDKIAWYKNLLVETGIDNKQNSLPQNFQLSQNFPNPFNPETTIRFDIKERCSVRLNVFDVQGRQVATIANGAYLPGSYEVTFDGSDLPSGIYFYRLQAGQFTEVRKMILLE